MKAAIVTTTRRPGAKLVSFVEFHLNIGFAHLFIFYEDEPDAALRAVAGREGVTLIPTNTALAREREGLDSYPAVLEFLEREVMARQILNAESAIRRASRAGFDWLLHIDSDELFFPLGVSLDAHFSGLERAGSFQCLYVNHEAVPESFEVDDCFREVTLFKTNGQTLVDSAGALPFIAYQSGKAAVRVRSNPLPHGVHRFRVDGRPARSVWSKRCCILHYPCCGFANFREKYEMLGRFDDRWFDRLNIGESLNFHKRSRDLVCDGALNEARRAYCAEVMLDGVAAEERARLLHEGRLQRIVEPSQRLLALRA